MRILSLIIFLFPLLQIYAQIIVTDSKNKPIPYVEVISNNKHFFAQTDLNGRLDWTQIEKLDLTDTLFLNLVPYEGLFYIKGNLSNNDTLKLKERINTLPEFSVFATPKKNKYQLINACYRSYQINNDSIAYYMDGKANYLSKINKHKFDLSIKEYRTFSNNVIENQTPTRTLNNSLTPSVPRPPSDYLSYLIKVKNQLKQYNDDSTKIDIYSKDSIYIGSIDIAKKYIQFTFNETDFIGTNNILNSEINRINHQITLIFRNHEDFDLFSITNFDELLYYKSIREYKIKHHKDKDYTKVFQSYELYIENIIYINSAEKSDYNSSWGMQKDSKYTTDYWKNCACPIYEPPFENLVNKLDQR